MKKIGLVLGSGGGKGLAHIGVLQVLVENNIFPDYIIGSSAGALVGGLFCKLQDVNLVEKVLIDFSWKELSSLFNLGIRGGLLSGAKCRKKLDDILRPTRMEDLSIDLEIVATNYLTAQPEYFNKGDLSEAIQASAAFPMLIEPLQRGDDIFWDGGLSDPLPVSRAREKSDLVIAVNLDRYSNIEKRPSPWRAIKSLQHHLASHSANQADVLIEPKLGKEEIVFDLRAFVEMDKGEEIIRKGRVEAEKKIDLIKSLV